MGIVDDERRRITGVTAMRPSGLTFGRLAGSAPGLAALVKRPGRSARQHGVIFFVGAPPRWGGIAFFALRAQVSRVTELLFVNERAAMFVAPPWS